MTEAESNKAAVRDMIQAVWEHGDLDALDRYWTPDCINHAAGPNQQSGSAALRRYHEEFVDQMAGFSGTRIEVLQQVGEGDRVVTQLVTEGTHTGSFAGVAATGRRVRLHSIRIDRLIDGRIAEHWSTADIAGLVHQLQ